METTVEQAGEVTVVGVSGDVDAGNAPDLRADLDGLLSGGVQRFVIDLSKVTFMDSAGIATLVHLFKRVRIGHGDVRLASVPDGVSEVFRLIRLDRVFDIFPTRDEATASFGTAS